MPSIKCVLVLAGFASLASAGARAQTSDGGASCNEFCQAWMNSGQQQATQPQQTETAALPPPAFDVTIASGRASMVNDYYSVRPDCQTRGRVKVSLSDPPRNGEVTLDRGRMHPKFSSNDAMSKCNSRLVDVTRVFYEPDSGFGSDRFTLQIEYPNGEITEETYTVSTR